MRRALAPRRCRASLKRRRRTPVPMPTRDDILSELGLAPVWRRRSGAGVAAAAMPIRRRSTLPPPESDRATGAPATPAAIPRSARIATLEWRDFAADVDACTACGLCRTRKKSVPGRRRPPCRMAVRRRGAGRRGGRAGRALRRTGRPAARQHAGGARRSRAAANVYIANVLKCRPPGNRTPEPREVEACRPYLDRQIELSGRS